MMHRDKDSSRVWKSVVGLVRLPLLLGLLLAATVPSNVVAPVLSAPTGQDEPGTSISVESTAGPGGLGMVPSGPDKQRLVRLPERLGAAEELPEAVDLTESSLLLEGQPSGEGIPPVGNQYFTNTCTGWAASYYYKTYQEWLEHQWSLSTNDHIFSPSFVYNQITEDTDYNCDDGAQIGDALALIVEEGDLPYSQFAWDPYNCGVQPSSGQKTAALEYDGINYGAFFISVGPPFGPQLNHNLTPLKEWLAGDDPFVLGFPIYSEFDNYDCFEVVTPPANPGSYRGLHAVAVVGYDDNWAGVGGFKIVNSWGQNWGCYGYAWLSYDFVRKYGWEAWWMTSNRRPWIDPQVPDRYSPNLGDTIIVDLTPYENDRDQSGTALKWYVDGQDYCTVWGEGSSNDVLGFEPNSPSYSGYDEITLILRDSKGAEDSQQVTLGWFDLDVTYYLPLGLGS